MLSTSVRFLRPLSAAVARPLALSFSSAPRAFTPLARPVSFTRSFSQCCEQPKQGEAKSDKNCGCGCGCGCCCSSGPKAKVGQPAPDFKGEAVMPDGTFENVSLSSFKGKWLVFFFYPLDFTFVCPTEIIQFSEQAPLFKKIGCEILGASTDSKFSHLAWTNVPRKDGGIGQLNYPLLADQGHSIAKTYGFYLDEAGHALRGTAIIDPQGVIRHISMNHPDVGRSIPEVLRLVKAYQFAAEHGEVCPSTWKEPGDQTIVPKVKESKEYFAKSA